MTHKKIVCTVFLYYSITMWPLEIISLTNGYYPLKKYKNNNYSYSNNNNNKLFASL